MAAIQASTDHGLAGQREGEPVSTIAPQIPDSLVVVAKIRRGRPKRSEQGPVSAAEQALVTRGYQQIVDQIAHDASEDSGGRRRQFVCTVTGCGKLFYQRAHLNIHIRSHTGYKPYTCPHPGCGKSFPQLGNMRTHERTHTGDRPFQCHIAGCLKAFTQRGNLKTHLIKVHGADGSPVSPVEQRKRPSPAGQPDPAPIAVTAALLPAPVQAKISNVRAPASAAAAAATAKRVRHQ
ncbi:DNA-binding transcription factor [Coemansia helicoidea]|uniref:DNA-binding transcription factor n=1 Tax=Coemansia helicoidea TaxID=1286919 RepID=A0ACC1L1X3_9FUNG|nr:DNA-binding transcription factor [Coemansia helicoidea]